jgi:hypothetical protein
VTDLAATLGEPTKDDEYASDAADNGADQEDQRHNWFIRGVVTYL